MSKKKGQYISAGKFEDIQHFIQWYHLSNNQYVMWLRKPMHKAFLCSMPFMTVVRAIEFGTVTRAIWREYARATDNRSSSE